ncbi:aspartate kinase [Cnuella takakiae]|uniref:Aspartate kinase n=1 Tax=Cnuella takakiae TaxID=1302690 RepID=A0A1M4ZWH2_9BACT|nr:bifunctional aspartate kinase/homoserine dehydrogenase I [Cnuella takakiae]OLY94768.1 bifunctional aspartate kinase/homoserine dehydrogenase I [Cnuella takakiae]SHF22304.1 aspartate kinase [Cnuella takakiae]
MFVLKFGGTSVAHAENIKKVTAIVRAKAATGKTIVVVSALGGVTDALLRCGTLAAQGDATYKESLQALTQRHLDTIRELLPLTAQSGVLSRIMQQCHEVEDLCNGIFLLGEFSDRTKDKILSFGELLSSQIIAAFWAATELPCQWVDSREVIRTDSQFTRAVVDFKTTNEQIKQLVSNSQAQVLLAPGFVAANEAGVTTTLGRGGSDYTAAIFGAAVDAEEVEIWTDVSGMMTADPRLVSNAKPIAQISYQEAMELSHFGAKVIYPPTIQPLLQKNIPVWVKNTFAPQDYGTVIKAEAEQNGNTIRGISSINKIALLSLEGSSMVGIPGFSKRLFEALAANSINVILITQASSEHSICVGVDELLASRAKAAVDNAFSYEIEMGKVNPLVVENGLSIIALVGDNMKSHAGTSGKMFGAMGRNGVNIRAIAQGSSERNISAVIASSDVKKAVNVLHEAFFETTYKQLNVYIIGTGNVGGKLLAQIQQQAGYLQQHLRLQVRVVGLANSRKMVFNDNGLELGNWQEQLGNGEPMSLQGYVDIIRQKNLRNSVFVDVTANADVAGVYDQLLERSISVVACNKIACSSPYVRYRKLKDLSREYNAAFHFETNVGASLPIIGTINDLLRSGDEVQKMQAVLSGTLNFVFNNYDATRSFAQVVRDAQNEGYTEPDPRLDLSGTDVARKIMILAREAGEQLEMEDITNVSFMPESCMQGSVEDFYAEMERQEPHFKALYEAASKEGKKLKFVAHYQGGKAKVGLQHIDPAHDFFHLYGKDNIVLFYTNRYTDQPMVVKGAGAGAEVTASGVFADIIRAARI